MLCYALLSRKSVEVAIIATLAIQRYHLDIAAGGRFVRGGTATHKEPHYFNTLLRGYENASNDKGGENIAI